MRWKFSWTNVIKLTCRMLLVYKLYKLLHFFQILVAKYHHWKKNSNSQLLFYANFSYLFIQTEKVRLCDLNRQYTRVSRKLIDRLELRVLIKSQFFFFFFTLYVQTYSHWTLLKKSLDRSSVTQTCGQKTSS